MEIPGPQRPKHEVQVDEVDRSDFLSGVVQRQRCLVPVEAFYIWYPLPSGKCPLAVARRDGGTMAVAGLWTATPLPGGVVKQTFGILTVPAAGIAGVLRTGSMPVIVKEDDWPLWLGEAGGDARAIVERQTGEGLRAWQVSTRVNHQKNDGRELVIEVDDVQPGDPLISFELATCELAELRARLEVVIAPYSRVDGGLVPAPPNEAFIPTAEELRACLIRAGRVCAEIGTKNVPRAPVRPDPVDSVFGYREELAGVYRTLTRVVHLVRAWPHCVAEGLACPTPDTVSERYREDPAFRAIWDKVGMFRASTAAAYPLPITRGAAATIDAADLTRTVEGIVRLAHSAVAILGSPGLAVVDEVPPAFRQSHS